jgi:hypothetical protein
LITSLKFWSAGLDRTVHGDLPSAGDDDTPECPGATPDRRFNATKGGRGARARRPTSAPLGKRYQVSRRSTERVLDVDRFLDAGLEFSKYGAEEDGIPAW